MDKTHISNATYEVLMRAGIDAGLVGASRALAMKDAGRSLQSAHPRVTPGEDTGDLNSGKGRGNQPRQFTGGDVKQMKQAPMLRIISNSSHVAQAMPTADMGMRIRPSSLAPAGMRSPMLVVIEGGKR